MSRLKATASPIPLCEAFLQKASHFFMRQEGKGRGGRYRDALYPLQDLIAVATVLQAALPHPNRICASLSLVGRPVAEQRDILFYHKKLRLNSRLHC